MRDTPMCDAQTIQIPHTLKETPYNYFDAEIYQMIAAYQRRLQAEESWKGKRVFLVMEGVAHRAEVYLNGQNIGNHSCGYTAFELELTQYLHYDRDNLLTVCVDSRESLNIPPFGHVIDYMTYGGIYRDVYLEIREENFIKDAFLYSTDVLTAAKLHIDVTLEHQMTDMSLKASMLDKAGNVFELGQYKLTEAVNEIVTDVSEYKPILWSHEEPNLYEVRLELLSNNRVIDDVSERIGFREAVFKADGFYLNGKKVKIRGCNRHQSFAYVGYAMPKSMQEKDAFICKEELKVNAVRTSHYPQSQYFIDKCDELGLLVFTEIPGWQHIGDESWREQACQNVQEMVMQYRNHPSIILWGVRINESVDDEQFYRRTNEIAHRLDGTRQTSGVRYIEKSQLLEDVYAFNDFSHTGENKWAKEKKEVTSDMTKGYLVSEYNGHMYPTKAFDDEKHRVEHVLRHAKVLDALTGYEDVAGSFMWCMFDYNTHKDFGSGDRICYHGIMDMFRNPKQASLVYRAQQDNEDILEVISTMDIGEYAGGYIGDTYVITNADSVRLYKNNRFIKEFDKKSTPFVHLKHGPIVIDDYIGNQLVEEEHLSEQTARDVKRLLKDVGKYGMTNMPLRTKLLAAKLIMFKGMKFEDGVRFYNKYLGNWGGEVTTYRFEAVKDGKVVKTVEKSPVRKIHLDLDVSSDVLWEENNYDVALVRIVVKDQNNNQLPYFQEPIQIKAEGNISIIGPQIISLKGGMGGVYVRSNGAGEGTLILENPQLGVKEITFKVK
jgi:beta-galactosidase